MRLTALRIQLVSFILASLAAVWAFAYYSVQRAEQDALDHARSNARSYAEAFAEHTLVTMRRVDMALLELTHEWHGDIAAFAEDVKRIQENMQDIAFQVGVADANGILVFSNLTRPKEQVSLADREHIRVHLERNTDQLFISRPLKGRVSGKWSIQFTRPIRRSGKTTGVMVVSVDPGYFARFYQTLALGGGSVVAMYRDTGEIMARFPDWEKTIGRVIADSPFLLPEAEAAGNFRRQSRADGIERLYGYRKLPEAGLILTAGLAVDDVLAASIRQRNLVVTTSSITSLALVLLGVLLARTLMQRERNARALVVANEDLRLKSLQAEQANEAKSRFLATMSHEIRTPMNGILGMAQLLLLPAEPEERLEYARIILNSGETLMTLLNDILDLSKVEAGKLELESVAFDPRQLVAEMSMLFAPAAAANSLELLHDWEGPRCNYRGDPTRLRQMISNLMSNAVKFTAAGRIILRGRELAPQGGRVMLEFEVIDTGIGIPPEVRGLLFKPFSQTDSSTTRKYGGTGLGLSILRSLAELMGGSVGVDSTPGQGSRFWFRVGVLPLAEGEERRGAQREAATPAAPLPPQTVAPVLVADDVATNRKLLEAMLGRLGYAVCFASDGAEAWTRACTMPRPGLVLMDCQMPVMDGYVATRRIREWEAAQGAGRLPVIALTAAAFEEDRQHCLEAGMDDFLAKPLQLNALISALTRWLPGKVPSQPGQGGDK